MLVNVTPVVFSKKWTWSGSYNIITIFVEAQVSFDKNAFFHIEQFGDPFYIRRFKTRRIVAAAVGTLEAINLFESLIMQLRQLLKHLVLIRFLKKLPVHLLPLA